MNILIIHQAFASLEEPGGTRHFEFARLLVTSGHRVTIVASPVSYLTGRRTSASGSRPGLDAETDHLRIRRAWVYGEHHRSFGHRVVAFFTFMVSSFWVSMTAGPVDVVWGTSPPIFQGLTGWLVARLKGAAFLFEVRDLWPQFAIAIGVLKGWLAIALSERLERFLYSHADAVMANSPGFVDHILKRGGRQVRLILNGADPSMFDPAADGADLRKKLGLQGKFIAMYAGAHGVSNDLNVLLEGAGLLAGSDVHFVLLGDGKEKPALRARAREMRLSNVTFLDPVPKSEVPAALAMADACIAILKPLEEYKTTYPNKVFDYMAAGRPVILAIDGVIRSVVERAGCGIYVPPGDASALAKAAAGLAEDRHRAAALGLKGRCYLEEHFSRAAAAEELGRLLSDLTARRRSPA